MRGFVVSAVAYTVAFDGIEAKMVEVQCAVTPGMPGFAIVCGIKLIKVNEDTKKLFVTTRAHVEKGKMS